MLKKAKWLLGLTVLVLLVIIIAEYIMLLSPLQQTQRLSSIRLQEATAELTPTPFEALLLEEIIATPLPPADELPTPIPTDAMPAIDKGIPPFIPNISKEQERVFWIYYWKENEVWRVDSQGHKREMLLDTEKSLGQWLTENPFPDSDCCWSGPRVVISPDGNKLALVVVDVTNISDPGEKFYYSIYIFDIQNKTLEMISQGVQPVWSPDSKKIAFLNEGNLYISDTAREIKRVANPQTTDITISEYAWSTDGQRLAYTLNQGYQGIPEIWMVDQNAKNEPIKLLDVSPEHPPYGLQWVNDEEIIFLSSEGSKDRYPQNKFQNLFSFSIHTKQLKPVTHDMVVQTYRISPKQDWIAIGGYFPHSQAEDAYKADIWLESIDYSELTRATDEADAINIADWVPDGVRLLVWQQDGKPGLFSLVDGSLYKLDFDITQNYAVGGLK